MTSKQRPFVALLAAIVYVLLLLALSDVISPGVAPLFQVVLAMTFAGAFAYLTPARSWIGVAIVGGMTLVFPFVVLFALGMPIYKTVDATWSALGQSYGSQWNQRPIEVALATFGPLLSAVCVSFAIPRILRKGCGHRATSQIGR